MKNFVVDLKTTERLAAMVPKDCILVSESGMQTHEDLAAVQNYGADAVLIGETLMRSGNIAVAMQQCCTNFLFCLHLQRYFIGVKNIGHSGFVHLPRMGSVSKF